MTEEEPETAPVKLSELVDAFEFVSVADFDEHQPISAKGQAGSSSCRDLDLGKRLALSFVAEELPGSYDEAREIFGRKGAYSRFKHLLQATGTLGKWYDFEARATETALRDWCAAVSVPLLDNEQPA